MKGTDSVWSVMFSVLFFIAIVWLMTSDISDPIWRWSIAGVGTIACLALPGGRLSLRWLFSSEYRKQYYKFRRGGSYPGYSPGAPWQTSPVGKSFQEYTDFYLNNTILSAHAEDFKRKLKEEMYGSAAAIYAAENPLLKCREKLAEYVVSFADWKVLYLKSEDRPTLEEGDVTLSPYISGELHHHIRSLVQYRGELVDYIGRTPNATDGALLTWAQARSLAFEYLMNCMNVVRADVNDCDLATVKKADWFKPFVKSMLI